MLQIPAMGARISFESKETRPNLMGFAKVLNFSILRVSSGLKGRG
jgi:hypothetical protein